MRRLNENFLKRVIREERSRNLRRRVSLSSLLFEAPEDDLENYMGTKLKDQAPAAANSLPDEAKNLVKSPTGDDDKQIQGSKTAKFIPVKKLFASQNEVGMKDSLASVCTGKNATWDGIDWGDTEWLVKNLVPGAKITFSNALLGANTKDGQVVLDGHHRWSQAFMFNPDCEVNVVMATAGSLSADETLKAVHLAILAKTGAANTKPPKGANLFTASESDVAGYLDAPVKKVDPATGEDSADGVAPLIYAIMKKNGITDPAEGKNATIKHVMKSIADCKATIVTDAPTRDRMPQADNDTNPVDAATVMDMLSKGQVNYNDPFVKGGEAGTTSTTEEEPEEQKAPSANESRRRKDAAIMERWQRLAGILKD